MMLRQQYYGVLCLVAQSRLTLCDPMDCRLPGSSVYEHSLGKNTGVGCHVLLQGTFPTPEIEPRSPALQADSLSSEPPWKVLNFQHSHYTLRNES